MAIDDGSGTRTRKLRDEETADGGDRGFRKRRIQETAG
jgi:hypothetical protein